MMQSSFGPAADPRKRPHGLCRECYDENVHRAHGVCFGRYWRIGQVCKHRLIEFRKVIPISKLRFITDTTE